MINQDKQHFQEIGHLGFGLMRLPKAAGSDSEIDLEQTKAMVDHFMAAGLNYFDTAYVYGDGRSEEAARKALVERYPRESFKLATKLCAWMGCDDEASAKQEFYTSLERTGAGYFDFYLLHSIKEDNLDKYDSYGIWDFVKEQKEKGLIKRWGFSFHDKPGLLDKLLTDHPDVDFVQLQLNYADWDDLKILSRANYEVARAHNVSIVVMEPVKGGLLADPPTPVAKILKEADSAASPASWAVRFAASLDGVITVLSGMSTLEQMDDNLSYMQAFKPLSYEEQRVIAQAQQAIADIDSIPCTACHYCMPGCPINMPIPDIFTAMNKEILYHKTEDAKAAYAFATDKAGTRASDCIACGQCEDACPQNIHVISRLRDSAAALE